MTQQNRAVGFYDAGGDFLPNVHDAKALAGYDKVADQFNFLDGDEDGRLLTRNQVVDIDTLDWVNEVSASEGGGSGGVMADYDVAISYDGDKIDEIVITGYGKTKTMAIGWTGDKITSIATTIS